MLVYLKKLFSVRLYESLKLSDKWVEENTSIALQSVFYEWIGGWTGYKIGKN